MLQDGCLGKADRFLIRDVDQTVRVCNTLRPQISSVCEICAKESRFDEDFFSR